VLDEIAWQSSSRLPQFAIPSSIHEMPLAVWPEALRNREASLLQHAKTQNSDG